MKIQLLAFPGCPNAKAAREALASALAASRIDERIEEVDTTSADTPESLRSWGSPTILIDGRDVGGLEAPTGAGCRLYRDEEGIIRGTPDESLVRSALIVRPGFESK